MATPALSRRALLFAAAELAGLAWVGIDWAQVARAADEARADLGAGAGKFVFLTTTDAADVDAIAAHIIPTDDTPGAREAGVVYFIDRALATVLARLAGAFREQLSAFQHACAAACAGRRFAELPAEVQHSVLMGIERTPFFDTMRMLTVFGMFASPSYSGNRDGLGWRLLGFEDQHTFQPPFGYYDRDYPGFVTDTVSAS